MIHHLTRLASVAIILCNLGFAFCGTRVVSNLRTCMRLGKKACRYASFPRSGRGQAFVTGIAEGATLVCYPRMRMVMCASPLEFTQRSIGCSSLIAVSAFHGSDTPSFFQRDYQSGRPRPPLCYTSKVPHTGDHRILKHPFRHPLSM